MKTTRTYSWLGWGAAVVAPALLVWSILELQASRRGMTEAADQVRECLQLAESIRELRPTDSADVSAKSTPGDLAKRIEAIVREPQLSGVQLVRVDPQPPKRIPDSAYSQRTTQVELRNLQLRQFVMLLDALRREGAQSQVRRIHLQSPVRETASNGPETWAIEMVLTDRVLTPKTMAAKPAQLR